MGTPRRQPSPHPEYLGSNTSAGRKASLFSSKKSGKRRSGASRRSPQKREREVRSTRTRVDDSRRTGRRTVDDRRRKKR